MAKLANWETTIALFTDEYQVPLLPPELAAMLALSIELSTPILMVLGLLTRPAALVLLGMTTVIEIFVYPLAWPTHLQWAAMLLVLLCRGAGVTKQLMFPLGVRNPGSGWIATAATTAASTSGT